MCLEGNRLACARGEVNSPVVWLVKYLGWAFVIAAGFLHLFLGIMLHPFLPSLRMYLRTYLGYTLTIYFFFDDIEYAPCT